MQHDLSPMVYDFRYNYYENFYRNRLQMMSTSGSFYDMFHTAWQPYDDVGSVDDGHGSAVVVNKGVDIEHYVKKHYNGDNPHCFADKLWDTITKAMLDIILGFSPLMPGFIGDIGKAIEHAIQHAVSHFFSHLGSFICTATLHTLDTTCGNELLLKMKKYRDTTMTDVDGVSMLRYYGVLGPRIVREMEADPDKGTVTSYLYAEYISRMEELILKNDKDTIFTIYFQMVDDMVRRYNINTGKGYEKWRHRLT